jgi:hypothetical protein
MNPTQHEKSETTKATESCLRRLWRYLVDRPLV